MAGSSARRWWLRLWGRKCARASSVLAAALAPGAAWGEWPTYQGNAAHTGYVPGVLNTGGLTQLWSTPVSAGTLTGLAVGGGTVFVTNLARFSGDEALHALDQASGSILWGKAFGSNTATISAPGYDGGRVYVQTDANSSNYLHAYDGRTGAVAFESPYSAQWETYLNPTPYGGNIYVGGGTYGGIYSFNGASGQRNWFGYVGQYDGWTPAVDATSCYVFTGSGDTVPIYGEFRIIDRGTGVTRRLITDTVFQWNGYTMNTAVVLGAQSDAFSTNEPGSVYPNYSPYGRLIMWDLRDDATHTPHMGWVMSDHFTGQASLAGGVLYVNNGGSVEARDEATGQFLWSWTAPTGAVAGPMIVTDNVVLACTASATYAVELTTHGTVWSYPVGGVLALSEGTLYIAGSDHAVHALGAGCYANCDGSTRAPVLNVSDFSCFINRFAMGDPYANCDASTTAPVLNAADFACFLDRFAAGCP